MNVCALIPHYRCEAWLANAVESLLAQTRPPDAIVVVDDGSPEPPVEVVRAYPTVTLLSAPDNGGPYRLVQAVIDATEFDAYLFQDADDWSAPERLEVLLGEASERGGELVGSWEVRVSDEGDAEPAGYPLDVNAALAADPAGFALLHPSSLVSRSLVLRTGGFATGLRFSGDLEFLHRAVHAGRVVNVGRELYFRRQRTESLTASAATGLRSPARRELRAALARRAEANAARVVRGDAPDLTPLAVAPAPTLRHVCGPPLEPPLGQVSVPSRRPAWRRPAPPRSSPPVFLVGAPRSGLELLSRALGQHHRFAMSTGGRWLAGLVGRLDDSRPSCPGGPDRFDAAFAGAVRVCLSVPHGVRPVLAHPELGRVAVTLGSLFPAAKFVHVWRPAGDVVASLLASPTDDGVVFTPEQAVGHGRETADAALEAERALGPEVVLTVPYDELVSAPEATVRRLLEFLGEDFDTACVGPLRGLRPPRRAPVDAAIGSRAPAPVVRPMVEAVQALVRACVPEQATLVVASKGDPGLVDHRGRTAWHFPQIGEGVYAGHHPATSEDAVDQLAALHEQGAGYFLLPASAGWWLGHYTAFGDWLAQHGTLVAYQEGAGTLWRLGDQMAPVEAVAR